MKNISSIFFIPDLFRNTHGFPEGFFDILHEPVLQGTGIKVEEISWRKTNLKQKNNFNFSKFLEYAGVEQNKSLEKYWASNYYTPSSLAIDYLFNSLSKEEGTILLTFEIPPWLEQACFQRGIDFIDIRLSPLRFARDLYIALRTSDSEIFQRISDHTVTQEEMRLEASLLGANLRMHQTHQAIKRNFFSQNIDNSLIFIGQTKYDASLLSSNNNFLRCSEFADQLLTLIKGKRFFYKIHPLAGDFSIDEISALKKITGHSPEICHQNAYQILSSREDIELAGISSGILQEAKWFDKIAHILFKPYVPLFDSSENENLKKYQQTHFQKFISPAFWHQLLTPEKPTPRLAALPNLHQNHARETIDHWWDYSKVITWERSLPVESFERSGGGMLRQRIETLEKESKEFSKHNLIEGHDFSLNSGERQVATRYEDIRADHRFRYEWIDDRLPEGGSGIDAFCGNGYGTWHLSKKRHVWGIDGSNEAIRLAEQHYKTPTAFFSQSFYPFKLPNEHFDFAVSLESIEHVEDGTSFFTCLVQSIKPGGLLFFSTPCEKYLPHAVLSDIFHFHYKHYTFEETANLALTHGLEIIDWAGQDVYSFLPNGKPTPLLDHAAMQLKQGEFGQFLIFCCRKKDSHKQ